MVNGFSAYGLRLTAYVNGEWGNAVIARNVSLVIARNVVTWQSQSVAPLNGIATLSPKARNDSEL